MIRGELEFLWFFWLCSKVLIVRPCLDYSISISEVEVVDETVSLEDLPVVDVTVSHVSDADH